MHPTATTRRSLLWGLVLTAGVAGLVHAQPPGLPALPAGEVLAHTDDPEVIELDLGSVRQVVPAGSAGVPFGSGKLQDLGTLAAAHLPASGSRPSA